MSVFCVKCGTENNEDYKFCKNCGALLPDLNEGYTPPAAPKSTEENERIYGIEKKHLKMFVGQNDDKILSKFRGMELADSKVSWCWPAAILGFFFGFFGISFWLFYRKMYKPAFLSVAIGTLFYIVQAFVSFAPTVELVSHIAELFSPAMYEIENFELFMQSFLDKISTTAIGINFSGIFSDVEKVLAVIFGGLFGLYFYKNHVVEKIIETTEEYSDVEDLDDRLENVGGVSGGMAFLGVVIMLIISSAVSAALIAAVLLSI